MSSRKPSGKEVRELHKMVTQVKKRTTVAQDYARKIELLSARNSLEVCQAIIDRLLDSLSVPTESESARLS